MPSPQFNAEELALLDELRHAHAMISHVDRSPRTMPLSEQLRKRNEAHGRYAEASTKLTQLAKTKRMEFSPANMDAISLSFGIESYLTRFGVAEVDNSIEALIPLKQQMREADDKLSQLRKDRKKYHDFAVWAKNPSIWFLVFLGFWSPNTWFNFVFRRKECLEVVADIDVQIEQLTRMR